MTARISESVIIHKLYFLTLRFVECICLIINHDHFRTLHKRGINLLLFRRNGFGSSGYFPSQSEIFIRCTYVKKGHRFIIIQYMDLPLGYRLIHRHCLFLIEEELYHQLQPYLQYIDEGVYDNNETARHIHKLMH